LPKGTSLRDTASFEPSHAKNPPKGLICRWVEEKRYMDSYKFFGEYFTYLPRSPLWADLQKKFAWEVI